MTQWKLDIKKIKSNTKHLSAVALASCLLIGGANAAEWKLGHVLPPTHPANIALEKAAAEIAAKTDNRVEIKVYPAGQIGSAKEVLVGMTIGTHEMAFDGAGILSQWTPSLGVFEAPFISKDFNHLVRMTESKKGQSIFNELKNKHGLRILDVWYYGTRHITNNKRAVNSVADLKGLKLRVPEVTLSLEFAKKLNMQPTPIAFSELYFSMQTGVVDGQENPLTTINAAKFYEVQKHLVLSGHMVQFVAPIVSENVWKSTSKADRKVVKEVFTRIGSDYNNQIIALEKSLVKTLEKKGMQVSRPDRSVLARKMKSVYKSFEKVWGKDVYSSLSQVK